MPEEKHIQLSEEAKATLARVKQMPTAVLQGIAAALDRENQLTISAIVQNYLSFPKSAKAVPDGLRVQTGLLRRSIRASKAVIQGQGVTSAIGSNLVYAKAHEFGATIPAMTIVPKNAQALRFMIGDRVIFAKRVKIGERTLPARAPVQRGIADRMDAYSNAISREIVEYWKS